MRCVVPGVLASTVAVAPAIHSRPQLFGVEVHRHDRLVAERLQYLNRIQPQAAGANDDDRLCRLHREHLADGRIDCDARTRVGRGDGRVERAEIDEVARMRRYDVAAIAAVLVNAEAAVGDDAHVVLFRQAALALAATEPREHDPHVAYGNAGRIRPELRHPADDLVPHRQRQHHATVLQRHMLAAAHVVLTLPDMQVGMAHPAMRHLQQHLGAVGSGVGHSTSCRSAPFSTTAHARIVFLPRFYRRIALPCCHRVKPSYAFCPWLRGS